jgi:acetyltransferase-like isoleucine patch superfamily enzyme
VQNLSILVFWYFEGNGLEEPEDVNWKELMEYYKYEGKIGSFKLKLRLARSWLLQFLASISPSSSFTVIFQRARGVKIGRHVFIGPNMLIDLVYPDLVTIEDYVSMGYGMIFAHANPTCAKEIKRFYYPRKVAPVRLKQGAWLGAGAVVLSGVTIGENSVVGACSLVTKDVKPYTVVAGNPAALVKELKPIKKVGQ